MKAYKCIMYVERNKKQGFKIWRIRRIEIYTGIYREQRDKRINSKCQRDREKKNNRIKNRGMENREIEITESRIEKKRQIEKSEIDNLELGNIHIEKDREIGNRDNEKGSGKRDRKQRYTQRDKEMEKQKIEMWRLQNTEG